jgi:HSP20 family protein
MPTETATDVPFGHLAREMSRMLERMSKSSFGFVPSDAWQPAVNLYETEAAYLVCVDLAGIDKETVDLHVVDNRLALRGRREVPPCPENLQAANDVPCRAKIHLMEIDHGPFTRDVELPSDVLHEHISASYRNGLLWIEIPKKANA